jgi:hypothetical protein
MARRPRRSGRGAKAPEVNSPPCLNVSIDIVATSSPGSPTVTAWPVCAIRRRAGVDDGRASGARRRLGEHEAAIRKQIPFAPPADEGTGC